MIDDVRHGEHLIHPTPRQLNGAGPWLAELQVARVVGDGTRVQLFNAPHAFLSRSKAVARCVQHGRDVIEGKMPDHAMLLSPADSGASGLDRRLLVLAQDWRSVGVCVTLSLTGHKHPWANLWPPETAAGLRATARRSAGQR